MHCSHSRHSEKLVYQNIVGVMKWLFWLFFSRRFNILRGYAWVCCERNLWFEWGRLANESDKVWHAQGTIMVVGGMAAEVSCRSGVHAVTPRTVGGQLASAAVLRFTTSQFRILIFRYFDNTTKTQRAKMVFKAHNSPSNQLLNDLIRSGSSQDVSSNSGESVMNDEYFHVWY